MFRRTGPAGPGYLEALSSAPALGTSLTKGPTASSAPSFGAPTFAASSAASSAPAFGGTCCFWRGSWGAGVGWGGVGWGWGGVGDLG